MASEQESKVAKEPSSAAAVVAQVNGNDSARTFVP
jgi:hypothetical protein